MEYFGCCALARHGPICLIATHRIKPAIDASNSGYDQEFLRGYSKPRLQICGQEVLSIFAKRSSMAASPRPKGGSEVGKTKRGKGTKIMPVADSHGLPVGLWIENASPHHVKLVDSTLVEFVIPEAPPNLVADK